MTSNPKNSSGVVEPADERAAFEAWAGDQGFSLQRVDLGDDYQDLRTQGPWEAWQARAALAASQAASHGAPAEPTGECDQPPVGWRCTRSAGHEGPCAAIQDDRTISEQPPHFARGYATGYADGVKDARDPSITNEAQRYRYLRDGPEGWAMFDKRWLASHELVGAGPRLLDAVIDDALASPTQSVAPVGAETVAWIRRHPDGTLTGEMLTDGAIEPVRKASGGWLPMGLIAKKEPAARNEGHGWVRPRPDGFKARCGGPRICQACMREAAAKPEGGKS